MDYIPDEPRKTEPLIPTKKKGLVREYGEALFWAILFAFLIRSFLVEPYKIPSKSMVPTLLVGDHIFVNKFIYGLRVPGTKKWIKKFADPKRGDIIVFIYPENESLDFIKRVVGLPGDHIRLVNGILIINDREVKNSDVILTGLDTKDDRRLTVSEQNLLTSPYLLKKLPYYRGYENYQIKTEDIMGINHLMQNSKIMPNATDHDLIVPPNSYFVMGDNRDQSADSRVWGFVPRENLKGKALVIWFSLDSDRGGVRWKRFGHKII